MNAQSDSEAGGAPHVFADVWELFEHGALIPQCAWCERVLIEEIWVHAPRAAMAAVDVRLTMSHTICPSCIEASATARQLTDVSAKRQVGGPAVPRRRRR
jgi:hypothetical protein